MQWFSTGIVKYKLTASLSQVCHQNYFPYNFFYFFAEKIINTVNSLCIS